MKGNKPSCWPCSVGVRWITEAYRKHIKTHIWSPNFPSGTVAQWPNLQLCSNIKDTVSLYNLMACVLQQRKPRILLTWGTHALLSPAPLMHRRADSSVGLAYMLVWCESVQASWLWPPQKLNDRTYVIQSMWNVSEDPVWKVHVQEKQRSLEQVLAALWWVILHGPRGYWKCFKVSLLSSSEMSCEDLDSADERSRMCGGTGTQHGSKWRRPGPQQVAPTDAFISVVDGWMGSECPL